MSPCPDDPHYDSCKWPRVSCADVLGHLISDDTSPWPCWKRTKQQMWAAYWKNCVGQQTRSLSMQQRCKMLNRCVRPILHLYCILETRDGHGRTHLQMLSKNFNGKCLLISFRLSAGLRNRSKCSTKGDTALQLNLR